MTDANLRRNLDFVTYVRVRKRLESASLIALLVAACCVLAIVAGPATAHADEHRAAATVLDAPVAHLADGTYRIACEGSPEVAIECPEGKAAGGIQMRAARSGGSVNQKFYLRNEGHGLVSLQSVASGLFLAQENGKVVQRADGRSADRRWKLVRDTGIAFVNAASGQVLSLAGGRPKSGAKAIVADDAVAPSQRWRAQAVKPVPNGCYKVKSALGGYLGAAKGSYAAGKGMRSIAVGAKNAEVFDIREWKNGWYRIESTRSFLALGARTGSTAAVVQLGSRVQAEQLWKFSLDRSGRFVLLNKKTGKAIGVSSVPSKSGSIVRQGGIAGKRGQGWKLVSSKRYSLSGDKALDRAIASILAKHPTLRSAYDHVAFGYRYISGNEIRGGKYLSNSRSISYAKEFIGSGGGNCYRFSSLMSWLARGLGYQSRVVAGWVPGYVEARAPHGWCEVRKGGEIYVCDPDMYNAVRYRNWYMQTYASAPVAYGFW